MIYTYYILYIYIYIIYYSISYIIVYYIYYSILYILLLLLLLLLLLFFPPTGCSRADTLRNVHFALVFTVFCASLQGSPGGGRNSLFFD